MASANALVGVATADLFPQVAVTASYGAQQGPGLTQAPINPIWSVGPALAAPLLDFGRLDALVEKADYRSREMLFNYKQTVLNAVREVDTAVDAYSAQQARLRHLADALKAARRAVTLATERFDRGLINSLNVIDAQRQEFAIEQQYMIRAANRRGATGQALQIARRRLGGLSNLPADPVAGAGRCGRVQVVVGAVTFFRSSSAQSATKSALLRCYQLDPLRCRAVAR